MKKWLELKKFVFILFLILIIGFVFIYQIFGNDLDIKEVRQYLRSFGIWAPIIFVALCILGTIFIPSTPFMVIAGIFFGFKYGFIYTMIGASLSSIIVFEISRRLGKDWAESILEKEYMKKLGEYNKKLESGASYDLIILRVIPIMPFNILNILMGISRIKIRDYLIGTIIGLIPSNLIGVYAGTLVAKIF